MTRVLLTGAGGQLGTDVVAAAAKLGDIELHPFSRAELDIADGARVIEVVRSVAPDVILHGAAYTAVDDCETNEQHAYDINGAGTANVVAAAEGHEIRVIYVSTDYVFDGSKPEPYIEADSPNPASVYGRSKLVGENAVAGLGPNGLVVRTSWVCGANGSNMVKTILRAADSYPTLTFVDDQSGKPTFTSDLAQTLLLLAQRRDHGIMHVTNEGAVSWFEFCQDVLRLSGRDPSQVQPCSTEELQPPRPAPRPANSVLENTRFAALDLPLLRDYREPLRETLEILGTSQSGDAI